MCSSLGLVAFHLSVKLCILGKAFPIPPAGQTPLLFILAALYAPHFQHHFTFICVALNVFLSTKLEFHWGRDSVCSLAVISQD